LEFSTNATIPPLTGVNTSQAYIGRSLFSADGWLNGTIDEFRIYDGRLTPGEISASLMAGPDTLALPVRLEQSLTGGIMSLNWPSYAAGYKLESTTNLASLNWVSTNSTPVISEGRYETTLTATNSAHYFRLRR